MARLWAGECETNNLDTKGHTFSNLHFLKPSGVPSLCPLSPLLPSTRNWIKPLGLSLPVSALTILQFRLDVKIKYGSSSKHSFPVLLCYPSAGMIIVLQGLTKPEKLMRGCHEQHVNRPKVDSVFIEMVLLTQPFCNWRKPCSLCSVLARPMKGSVSVSGFFS